MCGSGVSGLELPRVEQPLDVPPLVLGELEPLEAPPRLGGIVVRDGGLEVLARRVRLGELSSQPPEQADRRRTRRHRLILPRPIRFTSGPHRLVAQVATLSRW